MSAAPTEKPTWFDLLKAAQEIVAIKESYKLLIKDTPMSNDIACWMADFAQERLAAAVLVERERWKDAIQFYDGDQPRIAFDADKVRELWTAAIREQK